MKYLLDTDTLIDFIQDRGNIRNRIAALTEAGAIIGLCAITVAELRSGISQKNYRLFGDWLKSLPYWDISRKAAGQAGVDRKTAAEAGRTLHVSDCLIAACARERGLSARTASALSSNPAIWQDSSYYSSTATISRGFAMPLRA